MIQPITIAPGITLRCFPDDRFKQGSLSIQFIRRMDREEAALNALLPAVLLRGSTQYPDLRAITWRLDELYGASVGTLVRRVGDYQTTGFYCGFMEDRFALQDDEILKPMVALVKELLLSPVLEKGAFRAGYVESEKANLISAIESQLNEKRAYAMAQLLKNMCRADSFGIPRLGEKAQVSAITPESLYAHYRKLLRSSKAELFYVGAAQPQAVAAMLGELFRAVERDYVNLPEQTPFADVGGGEYSQQMEISQGKLAMGFVTPVTIRDEGFVAMQLLNMVFGGSMTNKLFMNIREKMSLCYDIGSGYHGSKGLLTVSAGIDCAQEEVVRTEILRQLQLCRDGCISDEELEGAKQAMLSGLRATHDSPGSIENYYASAALSGLRLTPRQYMEAVERCTAEQVAQAAKTLTLHSVFFLKGVSQ